MSVSNKMQKALKDGLQITKIDKDSQLQKHQSFNIEQYKEVDILPMQAKAIQMLVLGYDLEQTAKKTRIDVAELEHLITSEAGIDFMQRTSLAVYSDCPVDKRELISELLSRLYTATDRNACAIIAQISKMMDFEQEKQANITFVFADDPWSNK